MNAEVLAVVAVKLVCVVGLSLVCAGAINMGWESQRAKQAKRAAAVARPKLIVGRCSLCTAPIEETAYTIPRDTGRYDLACASTLLELRDIHDREQRRSKGA